MISGIRRRLFVVPLANNDHGKTTLVRSLVTHAARHSYSKLQKGAHTFYTPWAQEVDAYVFPRSFQEVEKKNHSTIKQALDVNDPLWWQRDLVLMPSHLDDADCAAIITEAHAAGFDVVAASLLLDRKEVKGKDYRKCMMLDWDVRWCVDNNRSPEWEEQVEAIGRDLWVALSAIVFPRG